MTYSLLHFEMRSRSSPHPSFCFSNFVEGKHIIVTLSIQYRSAIEFHVTHLLPTTPLFTQQKHVERCVLC